MCSLSPTLDGLSAFVVRLKYVNGFNILDLVLIGVAAPLRNNRRFDDDDEATAPNF